MTPWRSAAWRKVIAKPKESFALVCMQNAAKSRNWRDKVPEPEDLQRYSLKTQCACLLMLLPLHAKKMSHTCVIRSSPNHLGWCFRKRHLISLQAHLCLQSSSSNTSHCCKSADHEEGGKGAESTRRWATKSGTAQPAKGEVCSAGVSMHSTAFQKLRWGASPIQSRTRIVWQHTLGDPENWNDGENSKNRIMRLSIPAKISYCKLGDTSLEAS